MPRVKDRPTGEVSVIAEEDEVRRRKPLSKLDMRSHRTG